MAATTENPLFELFNETLRDVYWAEKHQLKELPKLAKSSTSDDLVKALQEHRDETSKHVERLERVFELIARPARTKKCDAMAGLADEADEVVKDTDDEMARDAGIIAAAQTMEHYEIARYGTLAAWADLLGEKDAALILRQTLEEEKEADNKLTHLADTINQQAEHRHAA